MDDETMAKLNQDINNHLYTLLTIWFNGTEEEAEDLERTLNFLARYHGKNWDQEKYVNLLMR
ncbi:MAG: hypothetical protein ACI39W_01555 [Brotaphodocola sp.]